MWWRLVLYVSFAPAFLAWMFTCLLARLLAWKYNYYSFLDGCEEFETCTYTVFQNCSVFLYSCRSPVSVPFFLFVQISCISTIFLYSYWSPISVLFSCIRTDLLYRYHFSILWYTIVISTMLLLDNWHLIPECYHLTPIWYHLSPATLYITTRLVIILVRESCPAILYYM